MIYHDPLKPGQIITMNVDGFGPIWEVCESTRKNLVGIPQHYEVIEHKGWNLTSKPIPKPPPSVEVTEIVIGKW